MAGRDNFTAKTKRILGDRVGYRCSCPTCRRLTIGPTKDISDPLLIAEAAHISAASQGGPRFTPDLTAEERKALENGIWLCASCHTMVDKDPGHYTEDLLRSWRADGEECARKEVEGELIVSGYRDPMTAAEEHFKSQFPCYADAHPTLGREDGAPTKTIPVVWLQIASGATLKRLVRLSPAETAQHLADIRPVHCDNSGPVHPSRFGVFVQGNSGRRMTSVIQIFKDGSIALGFEASGYRGELNGFRERAHGAIPWIAFEDRLLRSTEHGVLLLRRLSLPPTSFLRLVVCSVRGYTVTQDPSRPIYCSPVDTERIESGVSALHNLDLLVTEIARPLLDDFWQHLGVLHSPSYNEQGEFVRKGMNLQRC